MFDRNEPFEIDASSGSTNESLGGQGSSVSVASIVLWRRRSVALRGRDSQSPRLDRLGQTLGVGSHVWR